MGDLRRRAGARVLKREGAAEVLRGPLLGRDVVVKIIPARGVADRVKAWAGRSRAQRQWLGAEWLDAHWFATARPLALLRGAGAECLVMEALNGRTVLEHLAAGDLPVREQHELAADLGAMVARMTALGRYNRDHKPSNLIVERLDNGRPRVAVIDCVAILPVSRAGGAAGAADRMMASLVIEAIGCGCPPRRGLIMRALRARHDALAGAADPSPRSRRLFCRAAWARVAALVAAHGDPRPRVDPLAAPAG